MAKKAKRNWIIDLIVGFGLTIIRTYIKGASGDSSNSETARINLMRDMLAAAVKTGDSNRISSVLEVIADMERYRKFTEDEKSQMASEVRQMLLKNLDDACKKGLQEIFNRFMKK